MVTMRLFSNSKIISIESYSVSKDPRKMPKNFCSELLENMLKLTGGACPPQRHRGFLTGPPPFDGTVGFV